jgi:hypothetical protein
LAFEHLFLDQTFPKRSNVSRSTILSDVSAQAARLALFPHPEMLFVNARRNRVDRGGARRASLERE